MSNLAAIKQSHTARRITTTCSWCGVPIFLRPSDMHPSGHHFCQQQCCTEWKRTRTGSLAGGWNGGTRTVEGGRVRGKVVNHPRMDAIGYVSRAHLVMEAELGRYLASEEVVHHLDFNPANDDPQNLILFPSEAEHQRYHGMLRGGLNRS